MDEGTRRLIAGLLTFLVGLAVGMAAVYFFRGPERTTVDPIVVETGAGSGDEDARPGKSPGRGKKKPPRKRPNAPAPSGPSNDSDRGAVPVPPPAPPAGGGDDDDDDAGDDDDDDDDGTDD